VSKDHKDCPQCTAAVATAINHDRISSAAATTACNHLEQDPELVELYQQRLRTIARAYARSKEFERVINESVKQVSALIVKEVVAEMRAEIELAIRVEVQKTWQANVERVAGEITTRAVDEVKRRIMGGQS